MFLRFLGPADTQSVALHTPRSLFTQSLRTITQQTKSTAGLITGVIFLLRCIENLLFSSLYYYNKTDRSFLKAFYKLIMTPNTEIFTVDNCKVYDNNCDLHHRNINKCFWDFLGLQTHNLGPYTHPEVYLPGLCTP